MLYFAASFQTLAFIWIRQASSPKINCVVSPKFFKASPMIRITSQVVLIFIHAEFLRHNFTWAGNLVRILLYTASDKTFSLAINICGILFWISESSQITPTWEKAVRIAARGTCRCSFGPRRFIFRAFCDRNPRPVSWNTFKDVSSKFK